MYHTVEWKISKTFINYDVAISEMEKRVQEIKNNSSKELLWFLQHKSIYTAGTSAKIEDLISELKENYAIVIVTHSMSQASRVSQRAAYFHLGHLVETGKTSKIFGDPDHELTQNYIKGRIG